MKTKLTFKLQSNEDLASLTGDMINITEYIFNLMLSDRKVSFFSLTNDLIVKLRLNCQMIFSF